MFFNVLKLQFTKYQWIYDRSPLLNYEITTEGIMQAWNNSVSILREFFFFVKKYGFVGLY